jgi:hypothetical protein
LVVKNGSNPAESAGEIAPARNPDGAVAILGEPGDCLESLTVDRSDPLDRAVDTADRDSIVRAQPDVAVHRAQDLVDLVGRDRRAEPLFSPDGVGRVEE